VIDLEQVRSGLANREDASLPLAERAYRHLLHEIIRLSLRPGQVVHETELQQQLGMGRTPIREALLRLSGDKLVTIHPRRGTFVSDMNVTDLGAVYEVRADLESLAAKLAAESSRKFAGEAQAKGVAALESSGMQVAREIKRDSFVSAMASAIPGFEAKFGADLINQIRNFAST